MPIDGSETCAHSGTPVSMNMDTNNELNQTLIDFSYRMMLETGLPLKGSIIVTGMVDAKMPNA